MSACPMVMPCLKGSPTCPTCKRAAKPKLTREQRREALSLMLDGGYSRAEATAWVLQFGGAT